MRQQLILGVALVHLLLMSVFVFDLVGRQRAFLKQQSQDLTESLARTLAINSTSWVLANDIVGLQEIVRSLQHLPSLRYAMVITPEGLVLAHTEESRIGRRLIDATSRTLAGAAPALRQLHVDEDGIDVAAPIVAGPGKLIGWARVSQNHDDIARSLRLVARNGVGYMFLAILAGSGLAFVIGRRLTAELDRLLAVSAQIRDGRRDLRMGASRTEEVARLGAGLNEMLDEISASARARDQASNLLASVLHTSPDWIFVKDREGRMVLSNDALAAAVGKSPAEMVGQDDLALGWAPELVRGDPARGIRGFEADDRAALRGEIVRTEAELRIIQGRSRYFDTIRVPLRDASNHIVGLVGVSRDVSERKAHEAQIERLGRLYAALSEINQTIVRVRSREELFPAICRVLVEISRFKMAWIGWRDPATQAVRPIAEYGDKGGYLESIQIFADERSEGRGPTGTSIRENRTCVCNSFAADPQTAPWHAAASRQGFGASISLPVRVGGVVVGAVTAYAGEENSFGEREIALLEEAAADIGFALENFARDAEHRQAEEAVRQAGAYNRTLLEASLDPLVAIGPNGKIMDVNRATEVATGRSRGELIGTDFCDYFTEPAKALAGYQQVFRDGSVRDFPLELRHRDGRVFSVLYNASVFRDERAAVVGIIASARDITERKQRDDKLNLLNTALLAAPSCILVTDADGIIEWVNPAFTHCTGYTAEEAIGRNPRFLKSGRQTVEFYADLWRTISSGQSWRGELVNRRKDGSLYTEDSTIAPVRDAAGTIRHFVAIKHDVTARREAEAALRQSEKELMEAQRIALLGSWRLDAATNQITWTEGLYRMLGLDPARPPPPYTEQHRLFTPESWQRLSTALPHTLATGNPYELVLEMVRQDGTRGWMLSRGEPVRDRTGAIIAVRGVAQDITAGREAERQLHEQAELLNKAREGIIATDNDGRIKFWNDGAEALFGWTAAEMVGKPIKSLLASSGVGSDSEVRGALETAGDWRGEIHGRNHRGDPFVIETSITVLRDKAGRATGRLSICTDITEQKMLQEQFLRVQRLQSIGMLSAGIAHDLNNVLAPISMGVPLLRAKATTPGDIRLLDALEKCAERGAGLIRQILGFAQGVGGEARLVQVKHMLRDIMQVVTETFPKSIILQQSVPADLWPIMANPTQIHQVLLNLCVNARDAMPQGGTLGIRGENCRLDGAAARAIEGGRPGTWLVLEVSDTGTGIAPDVLPHIWDTFFTTKPADKGTGLGLSTVRGIVDTHRGFITVRTKPGYGTTFRIYLPAAGSVASEMADPVAPRARNGRGELILLVDDEEMIREGASSILTNAGYRVVTAADGAEAARLLAAPTAEFALVITDIDMPNIDGAALARFVQILRPGAKILAMSGLAGLDAAAGPAEFAAAFMPKPFTADMLLGHVERLLRGGTMAD